MRPQNAPATWMPTASTENGPTTTAPLGASYQHHVLVALTGNSNTHHIDHTAQPSVTYEYGVAAYWDGAHHPLGQISNRAYAQPWE